MIIHPGYIDFTTNNVNFTTRLTKNIEEIHNSLYDDSLRFEIRSVSSQLEGNVHHLYSHEDN